MRSFRNHLTLKMKGNLVCQWRQVCQNCSYLVTSVSKNECFKKVFNFCNKRQTSGHVFYVAQASKISDKFLYFSIDTE